ncbi:MAG: hypothetical protein JWO40_755 [Candidatus Doudnabacteria bacterium]|nr:hypothetical protein [Candidatus Doudnabacteria bacterium]
MDNQIYTCPMHLDIVSDQLGRCPKCGMTLVLKDQIKPMAHTTSEQGLGVITWKSYQPLIVIILLIFIASVITAWNGRISLTGFLLNFMTGFFLVFGGFKLMDVKGFAEGYSTYDLLAKKWFGYGYIYPFIELGFGFAMLSGLHSMWLLWAEFVVMVFSGLGVAIKFARREPFMCACLGTFLKVPLTYVTLIEDFGMAIIALILILL